MNFSGVKAFLESWGLGFDTPDGESSNIPYPAVYHRMQVDAKSVGGEELSNVISRMTDTTDSQTYLTAEDWDEIEEAYDELY